MRKTALMAATIVAAALVFGSGAFAAGDLSKQDPITVRIDLGKDGIDKHRSQD